jgi:phosphoribosylamine--glycine ligase / phosphoribosylformylglycinamidine cyclo-ligase
MAKVATKSATLRVLLVGSGGRESALAVKLSQSPLVERKYVAPGNGGTAEGIEKVFSIDIDENDFVGLIRMASDLKINLTVPGKWIIPYEVYQNNARCP